MQLTGEANICLYSQDNNRLIQYRTDTRSLFYAPVPRRARPEHARSLPFKDDVARFWRSKVTTASCGPHLWVQRLRTSPCLPGPTVHLSTREPAVIFHSNCLEFLKCNYAFVFVFFLNDKRWSDCTKQTIDGWWKKKVKNESSRIPRTNFILSPLRQQQDEMRCEDVDEALFFVLL